MERDVLESFLEQNQLKDHCSTIKNVKSLQEMTLTNYRLVWAQEATKQDRRFAIRHVILLPLIGP